VESKPRILLVDDDPGLTTALEPFLERAGFRVLTAVDGEDALHKVTTFAPDLVVLDVLMPKMDGREVLRRLRQASNWVPVVMLTQVGGPAERTMTLDEGADDYLNKPFDPAELVAHIRAVMRRSGPSANALASAPRLRSGALRLDRPARRAYLGGKELALCPKAWRVLEYLMARPNELVSREVLLDEVWGWEQATGPRTVDVRIAELRRLLQDDAAHPRFIETRAGQGYRFVGSVEIEP
jgi:DNA-binding response OmpR family regulator